MKGRLYGYGTGMDKTQRERKGPRQDDNELNAISSEAKMAAHSYLGAKAHSP